MGVRALVFDERAAPPGALRRTWFRDQYSSASQGAWHSQQTSSDLLNSWFGEMQKKFPMLEDANPENNRGTEYNFFPHFVDMDFAGSVAEEASSRRGG